MVNHFSMREMAQAPSVGSAAHTTILLFRFARSDMGSLVMVADDLPPKHGRNDRSFPQHKRRWFKNRLGF
jgi:hypothetical protein